MILKLGLAPPRHNIYPSIRKGTSRLSESPPISNPLLSQSPSRNIIVLTHHHTIKNAGMIEQISLRLTLEYFMDQFIHQWIFNSG